MNKWIFIVSIFLLFSCDKKVIQSPSEQQSDNFIIESSKREKERQAKEYQEINQWLEENQNYNFVETPYGFWIQTSENLDLENPINSDLDFIQYLKQYRNLNNEIIYSFEDLGIQNKILGKTEEIRGVESTLRNVKKGDKVTLLLPSFMAYGLYGDDNKIGAHQPLIVELEVLQVKHK